MHYLLRTTAMAAVERLQIHFALLNEGTTAVNAQRMAARSRLIINGLELREWPAVVSNGGRGRECFALPPGEVCSFSYLLARNLGNPGVYRVRWDSAAFRSGELIFRVIGAVKR